MTAIRPTALAAAAALGLAAATAAAARDDVTIGMQLEPPGLDPTAGAAGAIDSVTYANVFQGLTRFDQNGTVIPDLAERWNISSDGLTYTFHLVKGVTFSDGSTMDAEDVKFSLDRARAEDSVNAQKGLFAGIAEVKVLDPLTVQVILSEPNGGFLFNLAWGDAVIVAPETAATNATAPVGTGPYVVSDWVKGDRIVLTARDDYWGDPVSIRTATMRIIADPTAAFSAMMAGDLDVFPAFPAPENLAMFEGNPEFRVTVGTTEGETILAMNNGAAPLDDIRVREAVAHAIDRETVIDGAMYGYGTPIGTHFAPHNPAYVDLTELSAYDPEKSRALLAEAGLSDGFTTTLKLPPTSYARRSGEIIAAELAEVGITVEISNIEWAQWLDEVFKRRDYGMTIISHVEPMDIGIYARDDYYFDYHSPAMQELMAELTRTTNPDTRGEILGRAQRRIAEDYVNAYLFQLPLLTVSRAGLQGLWENAPTPAIDLTGLSWAE
ncbi:ABC transporter substrate-binding protein [Oceanicella sp. SM1341]|uniref:ABC transporter substrate-binding protein n=1 Tax=Oceanicella sp. SM1341 TaxID=1548889 RepID=UPI000E509E28|nr:ABC transporter substrate-binding protein [Oceanicella sp. SM1341]